MKRLYITLSLFILFTACESKPFTGYIVAKEYVEGHMCHDEDYSHVVEAGYVHTPHVHRTPHHHKWTDSEFILHVANKDEVRHINVDSIYFYKHKLLDRVTFKP